MPFLDRTNEFLCIVESKKNLAISDGIKSYDPTLRLLEETKEINSKKSVFFVEAKQISEELQQTTDYLNKLTKLIRKRSPFDDNAQPIQELTKIIKGRLSEHNRDLASLEENVKANRSRSTNTQTVQNNTNIVRSLLSRLYYTKEQFSSVLKTRTKKVIQQEERQKKWKYETPRTYPKPVQPLSPTTNPDGVTLVNIKPETPKQSQTQIAVTRDYTDNYLEQRTQAIQEIESTIVEISGMFQHLSNIVAEQGELCQRINDNVSDAVTNVEQGQNQLVEYLNKVMSNRGLILKIFFVMIVFIIFVGIFIV